MIGGPVLAFDCAAGACSVAVATDAGAGGVAVLARRQQVMHRGHAAALAPMIEATLADAGVLPGDLRLIATTIGPGSFTGVRIGLSAARGLALALDLPLAGLTTIETLLGGATAADHRMIATQRRRLAAAIDTRRGDFYVGLDGAPAPFVMDATGLAEHLSAMTLLIVGDGAAALCAALAGAGIDAVRAEASALPDPGVLARLALRQGADHWGAANRRDGMPRPLYLRPADVTAPKAAG